MSEKLKQKQQAFSVMPAPGDDPRVLRFIGSTEDPDRDDDIIDADGWKFADYLKNPVFLWAHNYSEPPIGKAVQVFIDPERKALVFDIRFPTIDELCPGGQVSEHAKFVETIFQMYKTRMLSAVSVGFRPLKFEQRSDGDQAELPLWQRGMHVMEAELFELSAVPIPANPNALSTPKGFDEFLTKGVEFLKRTKEESMKTKAGAKFSKETATALNQLHEHVKSVAASVPIAQEHLTNIQTKCEAFTKAFSDLGIPPDGDTGVEPDGAESGADADAGDSAGGDPGDGGEAAADDTEEGVGTGGGNNTGDSAQDGGASDGREVPNKPNHASFDLSKLDLKAVEAALPKLGEGA